MRHAQLVLDQQQAMQKCLGLEIERMIDVILRRRQFIGMMLKDVPENVAGPDVFDIRQDRGKHAAQRWRYAKDNNLNAYRVIADYVSGMTDNYATQLYQSLFLPSRSFPMNDR